MKTSRILVPLFCLCNLFCFFSNSPLEALTSSSVTTISSKDSVNSQIRMDALGNTIAVWQKSDGITASIHSAVLPSGGQWSTSERISIPGHNSRLPQLAVDANGNSVAMWEHFDGSQFVVQATTRPSGGLWSTPVKVADAGSELKQPQVAFDSAGHAIAVWVGSNETNNVIQSATLPFGGQWSAPMDVSIADQDSINPHMAVDPNGHVVAVWMAYQQGQYTIQAATLSLGESWSQPVCLAGLGQQASRPQVAVDPVGNAIAIWSRLIDSKRVIQAARLPFKGEWSVPLNVSASDQDSQNPQIAIDPAGNAVAVWVEWSEQESIVQAATLPFEGHWSAPLALSARGEYAADPQVVINAASYAFAVWDSSKGTIQAATLPWGGSWSAAVEISDSSQKSDFPQVALDSKGEAVVSWTNETLTAIQAVTLQE
jgi:hypothetical protein